MTKRKPYSRKRLKQRINGLTEILQDGVSAGDLPPDILKLPLKALFETEQETTS